MCLDLVWGSYSEAADLKIPSFWNFRPTEGSVLILTILSSSIPLSLIKRLSKVRDLNPPLKFIWNSNKPLINQFCSGGFVLEGDESEVGRKRGGLAGLFLVDVAYLDRGNVAEDLAEGFVVDAGRDETDMNS